MEGSHDILVHKFVPMPQAMISPDAEAAVDKEWQETQNDSQVKLEDAPRLLKIPELTCIVHDMNGQNHGRRHFEEVLLEIEWKKVPNWECLFVQRKQTLFLPGCVDEIMMDGKKQNVVSMWGSDGNVDQPTSFLSHIHLGCSQRECKPNETIVEQHAKMF